jgi:hypothetical protein
MLRKAQTFVPKHYLKVTMKELVKLIRNWFPSIGYVLFFKENFKCHLIDVCTEQRVCICNIKSL